MPTWAVIRLVLLGLLAGAVIGWALWSFGKRRYHDFRHRVGGRLLACPRIRRSPSPHTTPNPPPRPPPPNQSPPSPLLDLSFGEDKDMVVYRPGGGGSYPIESGSGPEEAESCFNTPQGLFPPPASPP